MRFHLFLVVLVVAVPFCLAAETRAHIPLTRRPLLCVPRCCRSSFHAGRFVMLRGFFRARFSKWSAWDRTQESGVTTTRITFRVEEAIRGVRRGQILQISEWAGEAGISQPGMPVILGKSQSTVQSDIAGLASFQMSSGGISGNVAVVGSATAGSGSVQFEAQRLGP
jgi:hypothetical protein